MWIVGVRRLKAEESEPDTWFMTHGDTFAPRQKEKTGTLALLQTTFVLVDTSHFIVLVLFFK